jgi:hypothetical protein
VKGLIIVLLVFLFAGTKASAQMMRADSIVRIDEAATEQTPEEEKLADSLRRRRIKRTIIHSAIVPGWGQINNHQRIQGFKAGVYL